MTDLLLCPFCGGEAELHPTYDMDTGGVDGWFAWCDNKECECAPETREYFTEAEAIEAWNTRADDDWYCRACRAAQKRKLEEAQAKLTCHCVDIDGYSFRFECSACRYVAIVHNCAVRLDELPNYCPNCGAKVVGE